jgi:hypothetical protein
MPGLPGRAPGGRMLIGSGLIKQREVTLANSMRLTAAGSGSRWAENYYFSGAAGVTWIEPG